MARQINGIEPGAAPAARLPGVHAEDTAWGYRIHPRTGIRRRAAAGEIAAAVTAMILSMAGYGIWLLPDLDGLGPSVGHRLGATAVLFALALVLALIARRGLCPEVQVDLDHRQLRIARRNRSGRATVIRKLPIDDIESVFIQRAKTAAATNRLCVRIRKDARLTEVAVGSERELAPILQRMSVDLRNDVAGATPARPARVTPTRVRSAFAAR